MTLTLCAPDRLTIGVDRLEVRFMDLMRPLLFPSPVEPMASCMVLAPFSSCRCRLTSAAPFESGGDLRLSAMIKSDAYPVRASKPS